MKLTPLDIKRHSFEKGFRGYDPAEVDGFLKQVADQLESLQEELRLAHERTRETEGKLVHYERVEMALQEALESAKASAKRSEEDAARRSAVILEEAELRAEQILQNVERERFGMRQDLVRLSSRQAEVAARLRGFLLSELEVLTDFQGNDPRGLLHTEDDPLLIEARQAVDASPEPVADEAVEAMPEGADSTPDGLAETPAPVGVSPLDPPAIPQPVVVERASAEQDDDSLEPVEAAAPPYAPPADTLDWSSPNPSAAIPFDPAPEADEPAHPRVEISSRAGEDMLPLDDGGVQGPPSPVEAPDLPLSTGGWTAPESNVAGSEAERERIRRILEDLD